MVENGEELAEVAKGLLDTVVGRIPEDAQTALLARYVEMYFCNCISFFYHLQLTFHYCMLS